MIVLKVEVLDEGNKWIKTLNITVSHPAMSHNIFVFLVLYFE